ncbi:MAG: hypothetical protein HYZ26_10805 [Chloroflexi bacterium]|nr:hypothetical protein [Chloroflexota bacterium]
MNNNIRAIELGPWMLKVFQPESAAGAAAFLMLHGWTGDENSMWVFASQLPSAWLMVAPRAPFVSSHPEFGGYSWVEEKSGVWPAYGDFDSAVARLNELLSLLKDTYPRADFTRIDLAGFSQGAALAARFALEQPERVRRLALLAGFLPEGTPRSPANDSLAGLKVFIAHGKRDETVPVDMARAAVSEFERAGATVDYCESDVGHKLGAECFRGFKSHFS